MFRFHVAELCNFILFYLKDAQDLNLNRTGTVFKQTLLEIGFIKEKKTT